MRVRSVVVGVAWGAVMLGLTGCTTPWEPTAEDSAARRQEACASSEGALAVSYMEQRYGVKATFRSCEFKYSDFLNHNDGGVRAVVVDVPGESTDEPVHIEPNEYAEQWGYFDDYLYLKFVDDYRMAVLEEIQTVAPDGRTVFERTPFEGRDVCPESMTGATSFGEFLDFLRSGDPVELTVFTRELDTTAVQSAVSQLATALGTVADKGTVAVIGSAQVYDKVTTSQDDQLLTGSATLPSDLPQPVTWQSWGE
ncbi:MAG: hypothetical protein LBV06_08665 [Propionibacteriaceae bacterium]|jgi:hypothetical protein|nr:hypothetical protein [Propionibacteriaceae bacterium]